MLLNFRQTIRNKRMPRTLIDNDCLLKTSRFDLVEELSSLCGGYAAMYVLDEAQYVFQVADPERARKRTGSDEATTRLRDLLASCIAIPVYDGSPVLTALSEYSNIDAGEAIIFTAAIEEVESIIFTGDKRAIKAFADAVRDLGLEDRIFGRVKCYEQIIAEIIEGHGFEEVAEKIRNDPDADKSMRACFSSQAKHDVIVGLSSYYRHLARSAPGLLADPPAILNETAV